jgi:hypothetical protein
MPQRYKKVQFIAFCIHTGPQSINRKKIYVGLENPLEDIEARCSLLEQVIQMALAKSEKDEETLKLFMMPEFFFRGNQGAYDMDFVQALIQKLQNLVKEDKWKNWLFVFGSIVGFSSYKFSNSQEAYNVSLIQKGGFGDNVEKCLDTARVVLKEFLSNMDFVERKQSIGGLIWNRVFHLPPLKSPAPGREMQKLNYDGLGVFKMDWITFGLELCLDHANQRLRNSPQSLGTPQIQIQLVPSCGMSIQDQSTVACQYGFIFNCDGYANYSTKTLGFDSALKKVEVMYTPTTNAVTSEIISYLDVPINVDISQIFASNSSIPKPKIRIYTPRAIPDARVVT